MLGGTDLCFWVRTDTYGIGIGIGSGRRIFLPPLRRSMASAAFLSIFFFPASVSCGMKAAMTMANTTKIVNTWTNFILVPLVGGFDDRFVKDAIQ